jgi:hypothetical protein
VVETNLPLNVEQCTKNAQDSRSQADFMHSKYFKHAGLNPDHT